MTISQLTAPLNEHAQSLTKARISRTPIAPLTETDPTLSIDQAYQIQLLQIKERIAGGAQIRGYKVGLTSKAMQTQLGVSEPDFGHLTDDMFFFNDLEITTKQFIAPKVEPEVAFVMGQELAGPGVTVAQAIRAVDFVLPALEIIDSRIKKWKIKCVDTIADNASSGGVVLGTKPTLLRHVDLVTETGSLAVGSNTDYVDSKPGTAVLGSPVNALVWLANALGARDIAFQPGDVILSGAWTAAVEVRAGMSVWARFTSLGKAKAVFT